MNIFYFAILLIILAIFEESAVKRYFNLYEKLDRIEDKIDEMQEDKE